MIPSPLFITSGPHLSGYRVQLGYATLKEAQDAHDALANQQAAVSPEQGDGAVVGWQPTLGESDLFEIAEIIRVSRGVKGVGAKDYAIADEIVVLVNRIIRDRAFPVGVK